MPGWEDTSPEAALVEQMVMTWLTESPDTLNAGSRFISHPRTPDWSMTEWDTNKPGKQRGYFTDEGCPSGVYRCEGYQPNADLICALKNIPHNTRLGIIVSRYLQDGYSLAHPGYMSLEVKYETHKHVNPSKAKYSQLSVEYANGRCDEREPRAWSIEEALSKGIASGIALTKADVYVECINARCNSNGCKICAELDKLGDNDKARYAPTRGYALYVLPVAWLKETVSRALEDADLKKTGEQANEAWKYPDGDNTKCVICDNVSDSIANANLDHEGNELLPQGEAERLACEIVFGPDLGTQRSVIRANKGDPPGWCAQVSMEEAQDNTLVTEPDCRPVTLLPSGASE